MSDPFAPGLLTRLARPPSKVAIVRASRIGDFLCATPALRALRGALPEAEMTLIGLPFVRELVMRSQQLDRFVEFPGFPGLAEQLFEPRRALAFFQAMQAESFDLAVQMNGSGGYSNPFTLMLGARYSAGFIPKASWPSGLDAACPMPTEGHEVQRWLTLTNFIGAPERGRELEFPLWRTDYAVAAELLAGRERPLIGLSPGSREETKCWPAEHFAAAARALHSRLGGSIVLVGGPDERSAAREIVSRLEGDALDLTGHTSLARLGAVIAQLAVLITNDSGPAHIAYALDTPTVTIFGDTDPTRWGPPPRSRHQVVTYFERRPSGDDGPLPGISIAHVQVDQVVSAAVRTLGE